MIKVEIVKKEIRKNGKIPFDKIFVLLKDSDSLSRVGTDGEKKSVIHNSLIVDGELIMVGQGNWDLKKNYSRDEIERIKDILQGIEEK